MKIVETEAFRKLSYSHEGTLPGFKQPNKHKSQPSSLFGEPSDGTSVKDIEKMWGKDHKKKKKKKKRDIDDDKMPKTMI